MQEHPASQIREGLNAAGDKSASQQLRAEQVRHGVGRHACQFQHRPFLAFFADPLETGRFSDNRAGIGLAKYEHDKPGHSGVDCALLQGGELRLAAEGNHSSSGIRLREHCKWVS
jgi:hypothetical protein